MFWRLRFIADLIFAKVIPPTTLSLLFSEQSILPYPTSFVQQNQDVLTNSRYQFIISPPQAGRVIAILDSKIEESPHSVELDAG